MPINYIVYERCIKIPPHPEDIWPEEKYIHDPKPSNLTDLADPARTRVWIEGKGNVHVGDKVVIKIKLYNGHGIRKRQGGDLVRVWMKDSILNASAAGRVIDNNDGSYSATLTSFWEGAPKVLAAIISPREVIALQFRRRYICPPIVMNTAKFEHLPSGSTKVLKEETPCNYDPQVPGYLTLCNLTEYNYGHPWFCGKPRSTGLSCRHWTDDSNINLWGKNKDQQILSDMENTLASRKYKAMMIPTNISLMVRKGSANQTMFQAKQPCHSVNKSLTWDRSLPTGYLYNRKWTSRHCSTQQSSQSSLMNCLTNRRVVIIGDSTSNQLYNELGERIVCKSPDGSEKNAGKHRISICTNETYNFTMMARMHGLPFCTSNTPRVYIKPLKATFEDIQINEKTVLILHVYGHLLNHHSHVFYATIHAIKRNIVDILKIYPKLFIVLKGPHTFSFARNDESVMWMPDKYADEYHRMLADTFKNISDRVMYLECLDITICTEQWHIHSEQYVISALVDRILSHMCNV